ncbi:hypothetical protein H4219_001447 [Mycoemilia scoparia]|uniref:Uncharacterized protein n=1 Tax=Mycoemilia scoparia TaxID=417184 RepID=A0A9W8DQB6_9FUNG|nr:hypothetical protein H4219_001447 [Mycoemilia scoparia]
MSSSLLISALVPLGLGYASSLPTRQRIDTFMSYINKPIRHPPSWVFAAFSAIFYLIIGYSSFIVANDLLTQDDPEKVRAGRIGLSLYWIQVLISLGFVPMFFGLKRIDLAMLIMGVVSVVSLSTMICFFIVQWLAGLLMLLFCAWTAFATYYTFRLWTLNRGEDFSNIPYDNSHSREGYLTLDTDEEDHAREGGDSLDIERGSGADNNVAPRLIDNTTSR